MSEVSIIIPVYNVEKYIRECLNSIIKQTFSDIEIICINDASPDNSLEILNEFAKNDNRIHIISHEINQGLGPARNTGIASATSKYIMFVDSDDFIASDMVEHLYDLINSRRAQMAWCGMGYINDAGFLIGEEKIPAGNWTTKEVLDNDKLYPGILSVCNKIFCRDLIKGIKQLPIISEDQPVIAEYLLLSEKIITTEKVLYYYRQNNNTLSKPKEYKPYQWSSYFYSHTLFFNILHERFPLKSQLRKQAILRHFSLLWRIKAFNVIESPEWNEHKKVITHYLYEDGMSLRFYSPVFHKYLMFIFKNNTQENISYKLINLGIILSRSIWLQRTNFLALPFDLLQASLPGFKLRLKKLFDFIEVKAFSFVAVFCRLYYKNSLWLISERPDTAQENGFYFFKYLVKNKSNAHAYYIFNKNSQLDSDLIKSGKVIQINSFKHKLLFLSCKYYVSSHYNFCYPITYSGEKKFPFPVTAKNVFLQHGITYADVSTYYGKSNTDISLFICGGKPEYDYVAGYFGYNPEEVCLTGFARFDGLHQTQTKRQILIMPSWRREFWSRSLDKSSRKTIFESSAYYKTFQNLINNKELLHLLSEFNYSIIFYPHYEVQSHIESFYSNSENVTIASKNDYTVQELLKESALLIVDTSSVHFDFAYMFKPVVYYRFDWATFSSTHLKSGYFDHVSMGFGEVVEKEGELIPIISQYLKSECKMQPKYMNRVKEFFPLHDTKNCERIYHAISEL